MGDCHSYAVAAALMVWYGRHSDLKTQTQASRRRSHAALALLIAAAGLAVSTLSSNPTLAVAAFIIAACGVYGGCAVFWALATSVLSCTAAAAGVAVINSVGNLAGFCAPYAIGWVKDTRGSFTEALLLIAAIVFGAMAIVLSVSDDRASSKAPLPAE